MVGIGRTFARRSEALLQSQLRLTGVIRRFVLHGRSEALLQNHSHAETALVRIVGLRVTGAGLSYATDLSVSVFAAAKTKYPAESLPWPRCVRTLLERLRKSDA